MTRQTTCGQTHGSVRLLRCQVSQSRKDAHILATAVVHQTYNGALIVENG